MKAHHKRRSTAQLKRYLLRGSSAVAIATVLSLRPAYAAGQLAILRGVTDIANATITARAPVPGGGSGTGTQVGQNAANQAGMASATLRALQYQSRVARGLSMGEQAQQAAREAAAAMETDVPDGLGVGGLDPVDNPVSAANDTTGVHTWDGADQPTETKTKDGVEVTVHQTQSRAILDWQTFNVGRNTTLTFDQSQDGQAQAGWIALNRVVGQLDPNTGLRNPNLAPLPSEILGTIKAPGTVLVLNQNGIIFGGTSQINVGSLISTTLEIGRAYDTALQKPLNLRDRNLEFLTYGLLGFADQASADQEQTAYTFSSQRYLDENGVLQTDKVEGGIEVDAGAQITTSAGGSIFLAAPKIVNSGTLTSSLGEVDLQAGRDIILIRSTGQAGTDTPDVRGFTSKALDSTAGEYVLNTADAIIDVPQGYTSLGATQSGAVIQDGTLESTTSVSRNGFIQLSGGDIQIGEGSTIAITPDDSDQTIPQDPQSILDFKPSKISIGDATSRIEIEKESMIYAPGGYVDIGASAGADSTDDSQTPGDSRVFIDSGATIDVAGLTDVLIPAARNSIMIDPLKGNELANDPNYRNSFLNGATVFADPRMSGVRADGTAWIGSPLIDAASYLQQVGVSAEELMTAGGNVTLGVQSYAPGSDVNKASDITIKSGAVIDISGGWVRYQAGYVQTTQLITAGGQIVDISQADPNGNYIGIYQGFTEVQPRWGLSQSWGSPILLGSHYEAEYTEGHDAGSLTLKGSSIVLDGTVYGNAYAGARQIAAADAGTKHSSIYGDNRKLQAASSQLPSSGVLFIQGLGQSQDGLTGAGDIDVVSQANYHPVDSDLGYGQSVYIDAEGNLVVPERDPNSYLPSDRQQVISLSADALSGMGLSEVALWTSGKINVESGANLNLAAGGDFEGIAGRTITIDGKVSVPSGTIKLQTINAGVGSVFNPDDPVLGSFDVIVNGTLSARGQWINDIGADAANSQPNMYTDGGSITLIGAPRQLQYQPTETLDEALDGSVPDTNVDISGSILLNRSSLLDVSSGGYVSPIGTLDLTAHGGDISLIEETTYFQLTQDPNLNAGGIPGFRVTTNVNEGGSVELPVNPSQINARVTLDGTILAQGFAGGGTFNLTTPQISFGDGTASTGTELPLDFFSKSGFGNFNITSYGTELIPNDFVYKDANGNYTSLGGYNALLATQTLTVGAGQTLLLSQSMFSSVADAAESESLRGLATGGDLYSVLTPVVPAAAWDQRAVNLDLGGLIELDVAKGGSIIGAPGGHLTVSKLYNDGLIRIPGGVITQVETLPAIYASDAALAVHDLSEAFTVNADGTIHEDDASNVAGLTNGELASQSPIYMLGRFGATDGIVLTADSVTDLSGEAIINPRATGLDPNAGLIHTGRMISGGTLQTVTGNQTNNKVFDDPFGNSVSVYATENPTATIAADGLTANPGAVIDISGASDTFDEMGSNGHLTPTAVWSDGGTLSMGNGGTITGATILAQGGSPHALGGTLVDLDPTLYQNDPDAPTFNVLSASSIERDGFDTFVAEGSLSSVGDVNLGLGRGFFLVSRPYGGQDLSDTATRDQFAPKVSVDGTLEIDASYIRFASDLQNVSTPLVGNPGTGKAIFRADTIDITGAVLFDQSVADVKLDATGDIRLSGVEPWQQVFDQNPQSVSNSLVGQLAVNGNLEITAAQIYPTTGSTFYITSSATDGTITFARSGTETPPTPYSAGGNLTIQAANIIQGGDIRVPLGSLTIGGDDPFSLTTDGTTVTFAPETVSMIATAGSITSVSAAGLVIPYGTTTDQIEWFFAPTGSEELTAPPQAILKFGGDNVDLQHGATVDVSGGGDLVAYEFISGTGGSRDVLDQFNTDPFTSNNGYQYPDGRQVYAIVPGLSSAAIAAYDPIYSSQYSNLYSAQGAGQQVYLQNVPGLAAGWYTLLPAQYATLPGGMRIVENTGVSNIAPGSVGRLQDGSYIVAGYYGTAGTGRYESTVQSFTVQTQKVFEKYSNIALTSADLKFALDAEHDGKLPPRLPIDAGRLILAPKETLSIDTELTTTPAEGGRGSQVDISGEAFDIVSSLPTDQQDGIVYLLADSLTNLNASSLLIGGVRTDNADGTTSLDVTANSIIVQNDASHPLSGPEVVLVVDGDGSSITLDDGATILASGKVDDTRSGDYLIDGSPDGGMTGQGAVLRVSTGPERLVTRTNQQDVEQAARLSIGNVDLEGNSLLLESSGDLTASPDATIKADQLALGASQVTFTSNGEGISGLVITPELQALFGQAQHLTIRTPGNIVFSSGTYDFNNVALDTPGLLLVDGDSVTLTADELQLSNHEAAGAACDADGAPACGSGALTIDANEIDFGSGTVSTYGFGGDVTLVGTKGVFAEGKKSVFDAGPAELNIETPLIADEATPLVPGQPMLIPSLSLTTTGDINISNPTGAAAAEVDGVPGSSISLSGNSIDVTGTTIRSTAGLLHLTSSTGIAIGEGATLETPGYSHNFGDAADPYIVSAPGGLLQLTAEEGDIDLEAGSLLSVGGGVGNAGTVELQAAKGGVTFGGTLEASAPGGGGSFVLDEQDAFDLATLQGVVGDQFNGMLAIRTATGDLVLGADQTLKASGIVLTADGGLVDIFGTLDVSGASGGSVSLFGLDGVTLESGSLIDAHANGYGPTSTHQAHGGDVVIGTDGDGVIDVEDGAIIDVSARHPGDRLVPFKRNGKTYYFYVQGDVGGTVHFRSPVIEQDGGGDTVNVFYDGTIKGASDITLEGFKEFDLAQIAADPDFVGVTINDQGQAVLDVGATGTDGQLNFLADYGDGTLVQFVQDFDISAANGQLGDLTSSKVFHENPGMELDYSGDIVLSSNWNLGAGVVDVDGAVAAGLMAQLPNGKYYVLPGMEGKVFQDFTRMVYRTDGSPDGEAGILTMRAGGTLDIKGSITDGFFQFHDQNDPDYLNQALGGGAKIYTPYLATGCIGACNSIDDWEMGGGLPFSYIQITVPGSNSLGALLDDPAPYNAAANSPAALGSLDGNTGDPLGSAQMFPLLVKSDGSTEAAQSSSYRLVGGADLASVDPLRVVPGAEGNLIVEGEQNYTYAASKDGASSTFGDDLLMNIGGQLVSANKWYQDFVGENSGLDADSYTFINFQQAPKDVTEFLLNQVSTFFSANQYQLITVGDKVVGVSTTLKLASDFMADVVAANFSTLKNDYKPPHPKIITKPTTAITHTLVRSGTGDIQLAAANDIDLTNGAPEYRDVNGKLVKEGPNAFQVGGSAVYTVGHLVDPSQQIIQDSLTGAFAILDPTPFTFSQDLFAQPPLIPYAYGADGGEGTGISGILIANPVYAEGGGDVSLTAGRDVLGRRDAWDAARINYFYNNISSDGYRWIGTGDQPWRSGSVGMATNIGIDPQLFTSGVGTLGGGNVSVSAGRDISDLTVVNDTSVTTTNVQFRDGAQTLGLWTFGGGNIDMKAGRDLLGGQLDIGSGLASIAVGGDVASDGLLNIAPNAPESLDELRIRLSDAQVNVAADGSIDMQGISALGVGAPANQPDANLNAHGFYSPTAGVSLLANGNVNVENTGTDVLTESDAATDQTASAVYPGTFEAVSMTGDLSLNTGHQGTASAVILFPSPTGELVLAAAGDILPATIAQEDGDPGLLPGLFSIFHADITSGVQSGRTFLFPGVLPSTDQVEREELHNKLATHTGDPVPNRVYAGDDIEDMILSVAKQTRIGAGEDIINMMFFGQNVSADDITRVVAGRDITATTELVTPLIGLDDGVPVYGEPESAVQGNTFIIGGPGSLFLEAGRDLGPFLNSAVTDGFAQGSPSDESLGTEVYAGGILSVGNSWNPWLPAKGANLFVEFGVANGQNFAGLRDYYLDPANLPNLDGDLFAQVRDANGNLVPDRNQPIYGPILIKWMQTHAAAQLQNAYGTRDVTFQQAYAVFKMLPELEQRVFMLGNVYFNELIQTSIPTGPSFKQYSRGYLAVNTLFPASYGYTLNDLSGGDNGSNHPIETGDLDLRLAAIETQWGGNIYLLGPGGSVLAGSTVRTADQAARRTYDGGRLFTGGVYNSPLPAAITSIPIGYEGILTLRGGSIYTFTDTDFLLNQSRLFTEGGGDIAMWSSNGDLNAGQGPKTSANFPPVVVAVDEDLYSQLDSVSGVSGAGIAAFEPAPGEPAPNVYLIAPRGTVDAGDAGVRVAGNLYIAALAVANANNFSVGGSAFGVPGSAAVDVAGQTNGSAAAAAAEQVAETLTGARDARATPSVISVEFLGFVDESPSADDPKKKRRKSPGV